MVGKVSKWAETHGFSRQNAYQIIKRHNIPWNPVTHLIDFEEADRIWNASKNPAKQAGGAAGGQARAELQPDLFSGDEEDTPRSAGSPMGQAQLAHTLLRVRRERLTIDQLEKNLVRLADVREFESRVYMMVKTQLTVVGSELQDDLAAETDPGRCRMLVDNRINKALSAFAQWTGEE